MNIDNIKKVDPAVAAEIEKEFERQQNTIELIASENITSKAVMEACGSVLTNKYAEGKPHKRFYNGCEHVDVIEELAQKRACELFKMDHANVQPHSGAQAKMNTEILIMKMSAGWLTNTNQNLLSAVQATILKLLTLKSSEKSQMKSELTFWRISLILPGLLLQDFIRRLQDTLNL